MRLLSSWGWKEATVNLSYTKIQKIQWTNRLRTQQQLNHLQDDFEETESLVWHKSNNILEYWGNESSESLKGLQLPALACEKHKIKDKKIS